jgi:MSHA biogenesis protein MshK
MRRALAALALAAATAAAAAAPFADPTRPPSSLDAGQREEPVSAGPRLESVLIAPDRRIAVISGQQVTIGSRFGDAEVVGIDESEVRLRRRSGEQSLKLFVAAPHRRPAGGKGK